VLKYLVYDRFVFVDRRRARAANASAAQ
jgi:hypothetical protein